MNKHLLLPVILPALLVSAGNLHAQIFSSDFSGAAPWNFDSETDPNSQLGGSDQLTYGWAAANDKSWVQKAVDLSTLPETGTLKLSGVVNLDGVTFGTSDFDKRTFAEIGVSSGNKSSFDGTGSLYTLGVGGWNNPGQFSFGQNLAVRFWGGTGGQAGNLVLAGDIAWESTITISGDDTIGWTIDATTVFTGDITVNNVAVGTASMTGTYTRIDTGFNGWQSVDKIRAGLAPDLNAPKADSPEVLATGTFVMEGIAFAAVPEPSTFALYAGFCALGLILLRRRMRA
ncbi:MAG: hypothetical protein ACP5EN_14820 [Rhodovulum sp.]